MARHYGVRELSRQSGFTSSYVSRLLDRGLTPAQIQQPGLARKRDSKGTAPRSHGSGSLLDGAAPTPPNHGTQSLGQPRNVNGGPSPGVVPDNVETLLEAQRRKETAIANMRELEYRVRIGQLVDREQMRSWLAEGFVKARDIMLSVGPELHDRSAHETDPATIEQLVTVEQERAIEQIRLTLIRLAQDEQG